jgi:protein phosphatase
MEFKSFLRRREVGAAFASVSLDSSQNRAPNPRYGRGVHAVAHATVFCPRASEARKTMQDETPPPRLPTLKFLSGVYPPLAKLDLGSAPELHAYGRTHQGKVRDTNEDQFLVAQTDRVVKVEWSSFGVEGGVVWPLQRQAKILMVADGLGGHAQGKVASAVAIDAMLDAVTSMRELPDESNALFTDELRACVERAQERLFSVARRKKLYFKPGTTLTMAYVDWPMMYVVHVGNSRCYLLRGDSIRQLTQDHTLAARLVEAGLTPEQAEQSRTKDILFNALGGGTGELRVDLVRQKIEEGDRVVLCTDGLHSLVADDQIREIVEAAGDHMQATTDLIGAALDAGGRDNVTAVVMQVPA